MRPGAGEVAALQAEIVRLNKVVQRAHGPRRGGDQHARARATACSRPPCMLQNQVRLRTKRPRPPCAATSGASDSLAASASSDMHALRRTAALQIQLLELARAAEGPGRADRPRGHAARHADRALRRPRPHAAPLARRRLAGPGEAAVVGLRRAARPVGPAGSGRRRRRRAPLLPRHPGDGPRRARAGGRGPGPPGARVRRRLARLFAAARHARRAAPPRRARHGPSRTPPPAGRGAGRRRHARRAASAPGRPGLRPRQRLARGGRRAARRAGSARRARPARGPPSAWPTGCCAPSTTP